MTHRDDEDKGSVNSLLAPDKTAVQEAEAILAKYDPEFAFRKLTGGWPFIITVLCVVW